LFSDLVDGPEFNVQTRPQHDHERKRFPDPTGNLLFLSSGHVAYNRNQGHASWRSAGLGDELCQPVFAGRKPGEDSLYFLFSMQEPQIEKMCNFKVEN
jgi:hypothetical protein